MKAYTFEVYKPMPPSDETLSRVHTGSLEGNRDSLNPSMTYVREFYAESDDAAITKSKQVSRVYFAKFQGLHS